MSKSTKTPANWKTVTCRTERCRNKGKLFEVWAKASAAYCNSCEKEMKPV